jgi:hypothetical protein
MAQATVARPTRQDRALGIIVRDEVIPVDDRPGFFTVRDTATGSGESHLATANSCTCRDHLYREGLCKHRRAVITEAYRLDAYAAGWDAWAGAQRPCCPQCGAQIEMAVYWIGGKGYCSFAVCSAEGSHPARMV